MSGQMPSSFALTAPHAAMPHSKALNTTELGTYTFVSSSGTRPTSSDVLANRILQSSQCIQARPSLNQYRTAQTVLDLSMSVITAEQRNFDNRPDTEKTGEFDVHHPSIVSGRVVSWVQRWGRVIPIPPDQFLQNILKHRGYDCSYITSINQFHRRTPTEKQLRDYDNELVWAIRSSDLSKLKTLHGQGKSLSACNQYSESVVHMACRRASVDVVRYLIDNDADIAIVDDYGRTPLHDACWRPEPRFDIVTMLLDVNLDLLRFIDVRGYIPLHYVRETHWLQWCAYLFNQIEKYWAPMPVTASSIADNFAAVANGEQSSDSSSLNEVSEGNTPSLQLPRPNVQEDLQPAKRRKVMDEL